MDRKGLDFVFQGKILVKLKIEPEGFNNLLFLRDQGFEEAVLVDVVEVLKRYF